MTQARKKYAEVRGIDIAPSAVASARQKGLAVHECDVNQHPLPFPDASFDTVVSLDVIEHVIDPLGFLAELGRVLKLGGWLIVSTPNIRYLKFLFQLVILGRFPRTSGDPAGFDGGHLHYFTPRDLKVLMRRAGCQPCRTVGIIPSKKLSFLRPLSHVGPVCEFLSAGILVLGKREYGD